MMVLLSSFLFTGCALMQKKDTGPSQYEIERNLDKPTKLEVTNANCGTYPDDYEKLVKEYLYQTLKDPNSLMIEFLVKPYKGYCHWLITDKSLRFGYGVSYKINAKNSFGGYVGWKVHTAYIKEGQVVYEHEDEDIGYGYPSTIVVPLDKVETQVEMQPEQQIQTR